MNAFSNKFSAPAPSVVHLVTLFRQISNGEIKIPAFQRKYVWNEKQVLSLLSSVYEGYPIGSLLFWKVDKKVFDIALPSVSAFPDLVEKYPLNYVLDGMQRLTTLFGVFNHQNGITDKILNVGFDLKENRFSLLTNNSSHVEYIVPLSSLFSPKRLLEFQSGLASQPDGDNLINAVLNLQAAFQEYMIPTVTIQSDDIKRVVGIFERVNSTGTRLSSVDFMRAITWSTSFDLSSRLAQIADEISEFGWNLKSDTIVKCAAIALGTSVDSESLVNLRNINESKLDEAFRVLPSTLRKVADFLYDEFNILSPSVVSYEGQILSTFLICFYGKENQVKTEFSRWFWACGLNEQLRGKPDDYTVRILNEWIDFPKDKYLIGHSVPSFTSRDFRTRRLMAGSALTNTFKMLFSKSKACDLVSGQFVPASEFLSNISTSQFVPVFEKENLTENSGGNSFSAKIFANTVLIDSDKNPRNVNILYSITQCLEKGDLKTLESQFITKDAAIAASQKDIQKFLLLRSETLYRFATNLMT